MANDFTIQLSFVYSSFSTISSPYVSSLVACVSNECFAARKCSRKWKWKWKWKWARKVVEDVGCCRL